MPTPSPHQPERPPIRSDLPTSESRPVAGEPLRVSNPLQIWLSECVSDALELIERRASSFRHGLGAAPSSQDEADREKRYQLLDTLLRSPCSVSGCSGRELIRNIIAEFLHEFSRQTLLGVAPLNIANPERPQPIAKAFWESQPAELFERARFPGVHHTAQSYHRLWRERLFTHSDRGRNIGRKVAWDATSEILRASIDSFRARGAEIFPDRELRASIYNDHLFIIAYARRTFCARVTRPTRVA